MTTTTLITGANKGLAACAVRGAGHRQREQRAGVDGGQTVEQGAEIIVRMAQVGPDGPTGGYFDATGPIPW